MCIVYLFVVVFLVVVAAVMMMIYKKKMLMLSHYKARTESIRIRALNARACAFYARGRGRTARLAQESAASAGSAQRALG